MNIRGPATGGAVAAVLLLVMLLLVGRLGPGEAVAQLRSSASSIRFLSSTAAGAAATILALMLTVLSLSHRPDQRFRPEHYRRIRDIARFSTIALTLGVFVLLLLVIPVETTEGLPSAAYSGLYYAIAVASAALGGLMVAIMLMLYRAITGLIDFFSPSGESWLVDDAADARSAEGAGNGDRQERGRG